jgi:hypothetical protein
VNIGRAIFWGVLLLGAVGLARNGKGSSEIMTSGLQGVNSLAGTLSGANQYNTGA